MSEGATAAGTAGDGSRPRESGEQTRSLEGLGERREKIASVRQEMMEQRGSVAEVIDRVGRVLARPLFFAVLLGLHVAWVALNTGIVPGVEPWDPYPFTLLATIASVEAPFFALLILMRQSRDRRIEEVREEVILQVGLHTEKEQTMIIRMLLAVADELDVDLSEEEDLGDLEDLRKGLDAERLIQVLEERIESADEPAPGGE